MGDLAAESSRRVGERMTAELVAELGRMVEGVLQEYAGLEQRPQPLTFDQVETIWEQEVRPQLPSFASMQSGGEEPPPHSRWHANWRVPERG
jgi:hypothetical protein